MRELAAQLKLARVHRGYTQANVAQALHISRERLAYWETGRENPDIAALVLLSDLYQMTLDDLVRHPVTVPEQVDEREWYRLGNHGSEGVLLLILTLVSALITPLGLVVPIYTLWWNRQNTRYHGLMVLVAVLVFALSLWGGYEFVSDNWLVLANPNLAVTK